MTRRKLILSLSGLVLVGLLLGAAFLVVAPRELVPDISRQVEAVTNRPITVIGKSHLALFPRPVAILNDVRFSGTSGKPLIAIEKVKAGIKFWPLFLGHIEAHSLTLDRPSIDLAIDDKGAINWTIYGSDEFDDVSIADPKIGLINVQNGTIRYHDARSGRRYLIGDINGRLEWPRFLAPARINGTARWNGEDFSLNALAERPANLMFNGTSPVDISFQNAFASGHIDGALRATNGLGLDGALNATVTDLQNLATWTGLDASGSLFPKTIAVQSQINLRGPSLAFTSAAIDIESQRAEGAFSLDLSSDVPAIKGTLAFDMVNLNTLLARAGFGPNGKAGSALGTIATTTPDSLVAGDQSIDLRISAGRVGIGDMILSDIALALTVEDGRADIGLGNASLAGGVIAGTGTIDTSPARGAIAVSFSTKGVEMTDGGQTFPMSGWLTGTLDLSLDLAASGRTWPEIIAAMGGRVDIAIADGAFRLADSVRLVSPGLPGIVGTIAERSLRRRARSVPFSKAGLTVAIDQGVARFSDIKVAGPVADITGDGSIVLADGVLAFDLAVMTPDTAERRIPFKLAGTLVEPVASADLAALARLIGGR